MRSDPTVCCIMLTRDRPEFARKAVECFRAQTYDPVQRMLVILDSSEKPIVLTGSDSENEGHEWRPSVRGWSIGELRNFANATLPESDILIHWDDDDWSHPNRIAEQVDLLQSSGKDLVGYNSMLFSVRCGRCVGRGSSTLGPLGVRTCEDCSGIGAAAWMYRNGNRSEALGTSFCYWRRTWEAKKFPDTSSGEDTIWSMGLKVLGVPAVGNPTTKGGFATPRMIARIHGGNTCSKVIENHEQWERVPYWDTRVWGLLT